MFPNDDGAKVLPKCRICGAKSTGIHYGVISCEGCKAFFKRESVKSTKYVCYFGNACPVGSVARGRCRACRYRKCLQEGMVNFNSPNAIVGSAKCTSKFSGREKSRNWNSATTAFDYAVSKPSAVVKDLLPRVDIFRFIQSDTSEKSEQRSAIAYDRSLLFCKDIGPESLHKIQLYDKFPGFRIKINLDEIQTAPYRADFQADFLHGSEESLNIDTTIRSVTNAFCRSYMDQIDLWTEYARRTLILCEVPNQPETTLPMMIHALKHEFQGDAVRADDFTKSLPGFTKLSHKHRTQIVLERSFDFFLINHAAYMQKEDYYWCVGPHGFHFNKYWMKQLVNQDWINFIELAASEFNKLHLTMTERYLFLSAIILRAGTISVENKLKMSFIHAHYLDALLSSVRRRLSPSDLSQLFPRLRQVMGRIISVANMDSSYYLALDLSSIPFDRNRDIRQFMLEDNPENVFIAHWLNSSIEEIAD